MLPRLIRNITRNHPHNSFAPPITTTTTTTTTTTRTFSNKHSTMEQPQQPVHSTEAVKPDQPSNSKPTKEKLPPLSKKDYQIYNRMAEHMDYFHTHFRQTWDFLYKAASTNHRPANTSLRTYLNTASQFVRHLTAHHTIEEQHIFPVLAQRMPCFKKELHLLTQHKKIHEGLEKFEAYIEECREGKKELVLREVKELMDLFGEVLWTHLDDEVRELGAENMRRFWTVEEMRRMPM